jgi:hypothetical protein
MFGGVTTLLLARQRFALFVVAATAAIVCACEPTTEHFDPRGAQVALYGEWDVNGQNPAVSTACEEAGLDTVELAFFDPETGDEFTHDEFRFPCWHGVYESKVAVLRTGAYEYVWRAYENGNAAPVLTSSRYDLVMVRSGEFILQAVDFIRSVGP